MRESEKRKQRNMKSWRYKREGETTRFFPVRFLLIRHLFEIVRDKPICVNIAFYFATAYSRDCEGFDRLLF